MKFDKEWLKQNWVAYSVALCTGILFFVIISNIGNIWSGLKVLYSFISPIIGGAIIAYLLNPLMVFYEKTLFKKIKNHVIQRGLSVFLTFVTFVLAIVILLIALIPQILDSISTIIDNLDVYVATLQDLLSRVGTSAQELKIDIHSLTDMGTNMLSSFTENLPDNINSIVSTSVNIGTSIITSVIAFILAIYFLSDKEHMVGGMTRLLSLILTDKQYKEWSDFWRRCNSILIRYIGGDILDAILVGVANLIFMNCTSMSYAVLISLVVGVTNLAPTFGPIVGAVIGAFILVLVNPWHALWFLIFTVILQTLDGYVIKPKLFGNTLGISSVWILIAIIVFGRVFGIMGVLLAIPFAAIIDFSYRELFIVWLEKRKGKV